jgi:plastocyanin domain-containing protein
VTIIERSIARHTKTAEMTQELLSKNKANTKKTKKPKQGICPVGNTIRTSIQHHCIVRVPVTLSTKMLNVFSALVLTSSINMGKMDPVFEVLSLGPRNLLDSRPTLCSPNM